MLTLRRAADRQHDRRRTREAWLTFPGLGPLELLEESRLAAGGGPPRRVDHQAEVITYVREGALAYVDSTGRHGILRAGEFQRMTVGPGLRLGLASASRPDGVHVFQLWLRQVGGGVEPAHEQKRFSAAERRGGLCVVASSDARRGSLRVHPDAVVLSALLDPGQHVVHALGRERSAWLHVLDGEVAVDDLRLGAGDSAGVAGVAALSFTARRATEVLLVELGRASPPS